MLDSFFSPKRIAVIGASKSRKKLGSIVYQNILRFGFKGRVYPVNVKGGNTGKQKVYTSVEEIPGAVDLAVIVIPALFVESVIKACGKKKIKGAIIISAGFGEQDASGKVREQQLTRVAKRYGVRLLGPNCLGLIVPAIQLNASFAEGLPEDGGVAVLSQSGAMAVAITDWAMDMDIGFRALVSLGNKSDIEEQELLSYFSRDKKTSVVVLYLESIKKDRAFLRTLNAVTKRKPVVILKPGKSSQAQAAVASHTGSLAGSYQVQHAMLEAAGAVMVDSLEDLFLFTQTFERPHKLAGKNIAIVTNAGGPGILATDALIRTGFSLAKFSPETADALERKLPQAAATQNPVDVIGDAPATRYAFALSTVMQDKNVDGVVALLTHQYVTETEVIARAIISTSRKYPHKPLFVSFIGGQGVKKGLKLLAEKDIPAFAYPEQAVKGLSALWQTQRAKKDLASFVDVPANVFRNTRALMAVHAEQLAGKFIPHVLKSRVAQSVTEALRVAKKMTYPIVAKVTSEKVLHKTDKGFVAVHIQSDTELRLILTRWKKQIKTTFTRGEGFVLQPYVPGSLELFIGAKRDVKLGPYIIVGMGGIFVNQLHMGDIYPLPLNTSQAQDFLKEGVLGELFSSPRGKKLSKNDFVQVIVGVSKMMMKNPNIVECDFNPVMISSDGVALPDVRIIVSTS